MKRGYKAFASMNIAIVGNEKITSVWAQSLALAGHQVFIGIKEDEQITLSFFADEFENIMVTTIADAAEAADVIILATAPQDVREASYLLDDVRSKVIIDNSYLSYRFSDVYLNTINAVKAITGSPYVVKCFQGLGFEPIPRGKNADDHTVFVAGDSSKAKAMARFIARDLGFDGFLDFGGSDSSALLDEMAICYHQLKSAKPPKVDEPLVWVGRRA